MTRLEELEALPIVEMIKQRELDLMSYASSEYEPALRMYRRISAEIERLTTESSDREAQILKNLREIPMDKFQVAPLGLATSAVQRAFQSDSGKQKAHGGEQTELRQSSNELPGADSTQCQHEWRPPYPGLGIKTAICAKCGAPDDGERAACGHNNMRRHNDDGTVDCCECGDQIFPAVESGQQQGKDK